MPLLVDLEDPKFLAGLNSVELALVSNIAARLQVVARQKTEPPSPIRYPTHKWGGQ